jgi:hypothetical protein
VTDEEQYFFDHWVDSLPEDWWDYHQFKPSVFLGSLEAAFQAGFIAAKGGEMRYQSPDPDEIEEEEEWEDDDEWDDDEDEDEEE